MTPAVLRDLIRAATMAACGITEEESTIRAHGEDILAR
jgi:hypothetical protein